MGGIFHRWTWCDFPERGREKRFPHATTGNILCYSMFGVRSTREGAGNLLIGRGEDGEDFEGVDQGFVSVLEDEGWGPDFDLGLFIPGEAVEGLDSRIGKRWGEETHFLQFQESLARDEVGVAVGEAVTEDFFPVDAEVRESLIGEGLSDFLNGTKREVFGRRPGIGLGGELLEEGKIENGVVGVGISIVEQLGLADKEDFAFRFEMLVEIDEVGIVDPGCLVSGCLIIEEVSVVTT